MGAGTGDRLAVSAALIRIVFVLVFFHLIQLYCDGQFSTLSYLDLLREPYLWAGGIGLACLALFLLLVTRGLRVSVFLGKSRIGSWVSWQRWLWLLGIRSFPPVSLSPGEIHRIRFGVQALVADRPLFHLDSFFELLGQSRVLTIPAASAHILEVMDVVRELCPQAEVDLATRKILHLLRSELKPENLTARLARTLNRCVRSGRLNGATPGRLVRFNSLDDQKQVFLEEFIGEHAK